MDPLASKTIAAVVQVLIIMAGAEVARYYGAYNLGFEIGATSGFVSVLVYVMLRSRLEEGK